MEKSMLFALAVALSIHWTLAYLGSPCPEPLPVANSYRVWHYDNDTGSGTMTYRCMDGYTLTSGSQTRTCSSDQTSTKWVFSEPPPACTLDCRRPRLLPASSVNYSSTLEGSLASYACHENYFLPVTLSDVRSCDPRIGRWDDNDVFCRNTVNLTDKVAIQDPDNVAFPAALALDGNESTCSETGQGQHVMWSVSLREVYEINAVGLQLKLNETVQKAIELTVTVHPGGPKNDCGVIDMTSLHPTSAEGHFSDFVFCSSYLGRPFGNNITINAAFSSTDLGRLSLCNVDVRGRPREVTCDFPPRIPRLKLLDDGSNDVFQENDVMTYACADGYTALYGFGQTMCLYNSVWSPPSLVCTEESNHIRTTKKSTEVHEDAGGYTVSLTLPSQREIHGIRVSSQGNVTVNVTSNGGSQKPCTTVLQGDGGQYVVCEQRPVGTIVRIAVTGFGVFSAGDIFDVFGEPFTGALECRLTERGTEYKGRLAVTLSGKSCRPWTDTYLSDGTLFPDNTLPEAQNFCRNPGGRRRYPFCLVDDPNINSEFCDILLCETMCKTRQDGADYTGSLNRTASGKDCRYWADSDIPFQRLQDFPYSFTQHNNCRNPGSSQSRPWCYVHDMTDVINDVEGPFAPADLAYDHCDVADCPKSAETTFISQSEITNSSMAASMTECHSHNLHHYRLDMVSFAREVCRGKYWQNVTTLCRFQYDATTERWSHVVLMCDVISETSLLTPVVDLTTTATSSDLQSQTPNAMTLEVTPTPTSWLEETMPFEPTQLVSSPQSAVYRDFSVTGSISPSSTVQDIAFSTSSARDTVNNSTLTEDFGPFDGSTSVQTPVESEQMPTVSPTSTLPVSARFSLAGIAESETLQPSETDQLYSLTSESSQTATFESFEKAEPSEISHSAETVETSEIFHSSEMIKSFQTVPSEIGKPSETNLTVQTTHFQTMQNSQTSQLYGITTEPPGTSERTPPSTFPRLGKCFCRLSTNVTHTLEKEEVESLAKSIVNELTVKTGNLSRTRRKKISVVDNRPTAVCVGSLGVILLTGTFLVIVTGDVFGAVLKIKGFVLRHQDDAK